MIKVYRKKRNLTQAKIASKTEVSQSYISKLEKGIGNPSIDQIIKIAKILNIDPYKLCKWFIDLRLKNNN